MRKGAVLHNGDEVEMVAELALPVIPSTITGPEARADYLLLHFWDGLDFADTRLSLDTAFMEQNFANFVALFPHAGPGGMNAGMRTLVSRAAECREASIFVMEIAAKYLADPNSPLRDDDAYISYAEAALDGAGLSDAETARMRYLLEGARMNRPGSLATDFGYLRSDGTRGRLHDFVATHGPTLLLFYDPDCANCKELISALGSGGLADGRAVLAIYPDGDRDMWLSRLGALPQGWETGLDDGTIEEQGLYRLPALPSVYLIDGSCRIEAKDVDMMK